MHAIPAATLTPDGEWVLFQSMNNSIQLWSADDKFRQNHKKVFRGHGSAGYACKPDMSPDGRFVVSGTSNGAIVFWDFKTNRIFHRLEKAHQVRITLSLLLPSESFSARHDRRPVASHRALQARVLLLGRHDQALGLESSSSTSSVLDSPRDCIENMNFAQIVDVSFTSPPTSSCSSTPSPEWN